MKDFRRFAALLGGALLLAGASVALAASDATGTVTILHTNDFHGRYMPFPVAPGNATAQTGDPGRSPQSFARQGEVNGFARLATAIQDIRKRDGAQNVLLLHAGDTFSDDLLGNLTKGEAIIRLMNAVGYQYLALGNHDFDYGVARTRELQGMARFPMRGANVIDSSTGEPFLGGPVQIFDVGGLKVGVLALGYHNTNWTSSPKNIKGLRFTSGIEAAQRHVPELRKQADLVVVLSHQGSKVDRLLARKVPGIDLIVGGHSHDYIFPPERIGNTWMVQALADAAVLGELKLRVDAGKITGIGGRGHILWEDQYRPDPKVARLVRELRAPHEAKLDAVIGNARERIGRQYKSESPFDHLVGEILMRETGSELALLPGVGYGISLSPGPIRRSDLYTLLPHPARLVSMRLQGKQIEEILEQSATNQKPADPMDTVGGLIQSAGMSYTIDLRQPPGQRVSEMRVGSEPLDPERLYRVATHSGMLQGIHRYETFAQGQEIKRSDRQVNEIVEAAFRSMDKISAPKVGAVTLIKAEK